MNKAQIKAMLTVEATAKTKATEVAVEAMVVEKAAIVVEEAAVVEVAVVVEAVEDKPPPRRKHTTPAQLLRRTERSMHLSRHNTHWDRIQGVHGCIQRRDISSRRLSRRCKT